MFYEVFVRSFADSNGDGVGDLRGLIERLDYLNDGNPTTTDDLGVTGIWLMPVEDAASYHGYDPVAYDAIEPDYGSSEDVRDLVSAAHDRGIAVIVDLVLNHTSSEHPWFRDARAGGPHDDWYIWSAADPGYGGPSGQQVWYPYGDRYYYAQFWDGMPDLDLENPEVTAALDDVARFWLRELGVDGFRLDAIKHLVETGQDQVNTTATHRWLEGFHDRVREMNHDALLLGEVYDITLMSSSYVPDSVDITFDFELADKIVLGAQVGEAPSLATTQADVLARYGEAGYAAFLTNHDQPRVMTQLRDEGAARAAASVLLTNPGVPFIYYGEELGMEGGKPDQRIRAPMAWNDDPPAFGFTSGTPWEPLEDGWQHANVAGQLRDPASLLAHYRSLIALRAAHPALRQATFAPLPSADAGVYAFLASAPGDTLVVVVNLSEDDTDDYGLSASSGAACGVTNAELLYQDQVPAATSTAPATPTPDASGGFTDWRPVPLLPAHGTLVIGLDR